MKKGFLLTIGSYILLIFIAGCTWQVKNYTSSDVKPEIFPDYTSIVIPPNISPLNFTIQEKGKEYFVEIYSGKGKKIRVRQASPKIIIPPDKWKILLDLNKGEPLNIDVYVKNDKWQRFATITDTIALEPIDNNLVFRLLPVTYTDGDKMGIYQRNLENNDQSAIIENTFSPDRPCMNCHSFSSNDPGKMSMHIRKAYAGSIIYDHGKYTKYNTKTEQTMAPAAYTAWHPNGELIAFSLNRIFVSFTINEDKLIEVCDQASDIILFDTKTNLISASPRISGKRRETLPAWSPDGKYLYFISAPEAKEDMSNWISAKYDLLRIPFDTAGNIWGEVDTLLTSRQTGLSITFPSPSPDGKYLLFCMIDHSYFSIFDSNSDLYLMDLETYNYKKVNTLNSNTTDSYHSWSHEGRWVVLSSKRLDEVCTRPFFAYFDKDGNFHKPFVLPQEDPDFYTNFRWNYNRPVLVNGYVDIDTSELRKSITGAPVDVNFDETLSIDTVKTGPNKHSKYY